MGILVCNLFSGILMALIPHIQSIANKASKFVLKLKYKLILKYDSSSLRQHSQHKTKVFNGSASFL